MTSKTNLGKWHHFKKSFSKSVFFDIETGLETHPVWIFWLLGGSTIWVILTTLLS